MSYKVIHLPHGEKEAVGVRLWNREHIQKHMVTREEAEEAYHSKDAIETSGRYGRPQYITKLKNGRLLVIFLSFERQEGPYIVSARDAGVKERRIYYEKVQKT